MSTTVGIEVKPVPGSGDRAAEMPAAAEASRLPEATLRRYLAMIGTLVVLALGTIYLVNWVVDPLAMGGALGFGRFRSDYRFEREVRWNTVTARRPDVVILGSSQSGHGIDPGNPLLGGKNVYNASISGGNIDELTRLMHHVAEIGSVRRVVFGIDFLMEWRGGSDRFNEAFLAENGRFGWLKSLKARLSLAMFISSLKEIGETLSHRSSYADRNGHLLPDRFEADLRARGGVYGAVNYNIDTTVAKLETPRADFFGDLRDIINSACQAHIALTLFAPPAHVSFLAFARAEGLWDQYQDWERSVVAAIHDAPCSVSFWDFTTVNPISTEPFPPPNDRRELVNYWDMFHYRVPIGDRLVAAMLGSAAPSGVSDLGQRLTQDNLDAFLRQQTVALDAWEAGHPGDVARIKERAASALASGAAAP
jgi:hypothetical protein